MRVVVLFSLIRSLQSKLEPSFLKLNLPLQILAYSLLVFNMEHLDYNKNTPLLHIMK